MNPLSARRGNRPSRRQGSSSRALGLALLLLAVSGPTAAGAIDLADGKLFLSGNGAWSWEATTGDHAVYGHGVPDGEWESAMFDLLAVARPTDDVSISAQLGFDGMRVSAEWVFLEWRISDALRLRAGRVKQPLGNYAELQFTGTARPLFDLPTAVYGPNLIAAEAYSGLGLTGELHVGEVWSVQYDLWGGGVELPSYEPFSLFDGRATGPEVEPPAFEEEHVENLVGARASLVTPSGLTFRASGFGGNIVTDMDGRLELWVGGASIWYRGDRLWVSAEGFYSEEVGFERTWAGYGEVAWFLTHELQVAGRYDLSRTRLPGWVSSDPLLRHASWTAGINYWILPTAVVKASVDVVEGSRFILREEWREASYEGGSVALPLERPARRTIRFLLGTQFTF
jgi:hypothetical protein